MSKSVNGKFPETDDTEIAQRVGCKVSARVEGVRKFRQVNPRIDYYPIPDAAAAIEWLRERNPKVSTRELIDVLIIEGQQSLSGND